MPSLTQLRMKKHELMMRQMVIEIQQGKLNVAQAAAKFEVTRKTVERWIEIVEEDRFAEAAQADQPPPLGPSVSAGSRQKRPIEQPAAADSDEVEALKSQLQAVRSQLEVADFKALYYATLLRVAEEELGIDIEKKFVPHRRSGKPSASC
jgi:hypothetical protein